MNKLKVAIIGSGNIGTDLMIKILRNAKHLEMAVMVGIDPASDGLARAQRMGVATTHDGVKGLTGMDVFKDIDFVFDATSASAHVKNDAFLRSIKPGIRLIDLTPAAIGPYCVPVVNLEQNLDRLNVNMVTCGGQATICRNRRLDRQQIGRPRHPRQHRRIHRDHLQSHRGDRRRNQGQGDHRDEPGRAAADYARHGVCAV
jgi:acetaldehyde dehydrogenase